VLLKATIWLEHKAMDLFKGKTGGWNTFLKYFIAWLILFGSKFVILEALSQVFGTKVHFGGMWHGVIALIVVVVVMLVAEEVMVRIYRKLAEKADSDPAK
jgi:divalent metal cation (Fe/Co/Zn/Cd) transporter